jgi:hypothetical protein
LLKLLLNRSLYFGGSLPPCLLKFLAFVGRLFDLRLWLDRCLLLGLLALLLPSGIGS